MKVIVTGSLGHISKPLTAELIQHGHTVTVISSKSEKQKDIEAVGATAAIGSLNDSSFLTATFAGADALFAMIPPNHTEGDQLAYYRRIGSNYVQAVQLSGIKQVVHLSSYGAHLDSGTGIILGSHQVEGMLNELQDTAITHLRPGYFYYNLNAFIGLIQEAGIMGSNYGGDDKLILVDPADIAVVAAEELTTPASGTKVRYIASDEYTCNEAAHILGAAIGKPDLQWLTFANEQVQESLEKRGLPAAFATKLVELGASIHSGKLQEDYYLHQPATMGKVKLADFARDFAAAFK